MKYGFWERDWLRQKDTCAASTLAPVDTQSTDSLEMRFWLFYIYFHFLNLYLFYHFFFLGMLLDDNMFTQWTGVIKIAVKCTFQLSHSPRTSLSLVSQHLHTPGLDKGQVGFFRLLLSFLCDLDFIGAFLVLRMLEAFCSITTLSLF